MSDNEYRWLTPMSQQFLEKDYLLPGQTVDERVKVIANAAGTILKDEHFAEKFISYFKKGWFSLSTPIWTNFGTDRGLPISCFGSSMDDSLDSILTTQAEVGMMSKYGGGTSIFYGHLRPRGAIIKDNGTSSGSVHFMQLPNQTVDVISQGSTRRGSCAVYLPIEHPDIWEFLGIRSEGNPIQNLSFGVTITDQWMLEMLGTDTLLAMFGNEAGKRFGTTHVKPDADKRKLWAKVIETRNNTGYPYLVWIDNANNGAPEVYRLQDRKIVASNLCSEIMLPSTSKESFVCDLSSMNIYYFDEWRDTDAVEVLTFFLDAAMEEFILKGRQIAFMEKAVKFAERHRAIGIGWMGWHSFLQKNMIAFESLEAKFLNSEVARNIKDKAYEASAKLACIYGEPKYLKGFGRRNSTLLAIAPTKSSAFILGQVSEGVEPHRANYYIKDLAKGKFTIKNLELQNLLEKKEMNTDEVWDSILANRGSVQHLSGLTEHEKDVFRTFAEISQKEILIQASARQKYIDQGQSINLMIHPTKHSVKDINALYTFAWFHGIKSLYYQINLNASQEFSRGLLECKSCES